MISLSPRSKGMLLGVGLFLLGLIVGVAADRWLLMHRRPFPMASISSRPPRERLLPRIIRDLQLTEEQERNINRILDTSRESIGQVQKQVRREMRDITEDTRTKIEALLTPEQRQEYSEMRKQMRPQRRRWGPRRQGPY